MFYLRCSWCVYKPYWHSSGNRFSFGEWVLQRRAHFDCSLVAPFFLTFNERKMVMNVGILYSWQARDNPSSHKPRWILIFDLNSQPDTQVITMNTKIIIFAKLYPQIRTKESINYSKTRMVSAHSVRLTKSVHMNSDSEGNTALDCFLIFHECGS